MVHREWKSGNRHVGGSCLHGRDASKKWRKRNLGRSGEEKGGTKTTFIKNREGGKVLEHKKTRGGGKCKRNVPACKAVQGVFKVVNQESLGGGGKSNGEIRKERAKLRGEKNYQGYHNDKRRRKTKGKKSKSTSACCEKKKEAVQKNECSKGGRENGLPTNRKAHQVQWKEKRNNITRKHARRESARKGESTQRASLCMFGFEVGSAYREVRDGENLYYVLRTYYARMGGLGAIPRGWEEVDDEAKRKTENRNVSGEEIQFCSSTHSRDLQESNGGKREDSPKKQTSPACRMPNHKGV